MANPTYVFREDLADEKQRQHELATQGLGAPAPATQQPQPLGQPQQAPQGGDPFASLAKTMAANQPQAPAQPQAVQPVPKAQVNPFEAFSAALEAQNPFKSQIQQQVTNTLDNPYQAVDAATAAARDKGAREANAAAEERRGQAVTAYGGYGSGQATRDLNKFQDNRLLNDQTFELNAAANRATVGDQARQGAINQGLGLLGESRAGATTTASLADSAASRASQEKIAYAGLSQQDRQMAQQASQFQSQQDFTAAMTEKGYAQDAIARAWQAAEAEKARVSQEKVAFAGLSIQEKQLAQQALQAKDELTFKRDALANGNDQASIDRAWNAAQQDKQLASQEKISFAQLSLEEKKLVNQADQFDNELDFKKAALANGNDQAAIDRAWNASQNTEERVLREKLANAQIGSAERLQAGEQAWQSAEAAKAQTLEKMLSDDRIKAQFGLATLDQTFQEKMQATGYLQTKDLQTMRNDFERELQASGIAADVAKQLADQQFSSMEAQRDRVFSASQSELNRTWESGERIGAQDWQTSLKQLEFNQQDLMQARDEALQKGLQTEQIDAEIKKVGMQIASQELMSAAQMLQEDNQFRNEFMLKYNTTQEELTQNRLKLEDDLLTSLANREGLGLQNDIAKLAIKNEKVKTAMDLASWGVEIGNGSPEAMAPFVASIGQALSTALKEQGVSLTEDQIAKMIAPVATTDTTGGTGTTGKIGTVESYENFQDYLDTKSSEYSSAINLENVDSIGKQIATSKPGSWPYQIPAAGTSPAQKALWNAPGAAANFTKVVSPGASTNQIFSKTQAGNDYLWLQKFMDEGLTESQAIDLASKSIGKDRILKAYKAITGKDYGGTSTTGSTSIGSNSGTVIA